MPAWEVEVSGVSVAEVDASVSEDWESLNKGSARIRNTSRNRSLAQHDASLIIKRGGTNFLSGFVTGKNFHPDYIDLEGHSSSYKLGKKPFTSAGSYAFRIWDNANDILSAITDGTGYVAEECPTDFLSGVRFKNSSKLKAIKTLNDAMSGTTWWFEGDDIHISRSRGTQKSVDLTLDYSSSENSKDTVNKVTVIGPEDKITVSDPSSPFEGEDVIKVSNVYSKDILRNYAKNKLEEKKEPMKTIPVKIGSFEKVEPGDEILVEEEKIDVSGWYTVKKVERKVDGQDVELVYSEDRLTSDVGRMLGNLRDRNEPLEEGADKTGAHYDYTWSDDFVVDGDMEKEDAGFWHSDDGNAWSAFKVTNPAKGERSLFLFSESGAGNRVVYQGRDAVVPGGRVGPVYDEPVYTNVDRAKTVWVEGDVYSLVSASAAGIGFRTFDEDKNLQNTKILGWNEGTGSWEHINKQAPLSDTTKYIVPVLKARDVDTGHNYFDNISMRKTQAGADVTSGHIASSFSVNYGKPAFDHVYFDGSSMYRAGDDEFISAATAPIDTPEIATDAIISEKISALAVKAQDIADNAVTNPKISAGAVSEGKIQDLAISTSKIANDAIRHAQISAQAIQETSIGPSAISTPKIQTGAITTGLINANAITSELISANAIVGEKISSGSIVSDKIAADAIWAVNLSAGSVTASKIASNSVDTTHLKADSVKAGIIDADAVTTDELAADAVWASNISAGTITTEKIAANAIRAEAISAEAITSNHIKTLDLGTGQLTVGSGESYWIEFDASTASETRMYPSTSATCYIGKEGRSFAFAYIDAIITSDLQPLKDNKGTLGDSGTRYSNVYSTTGSFDDIQSTGGGYVNSGKFSDLDTSSRLKIPVGSDMYD